MKKQHQTEQHQTEQHQTEQYRATKTKNTRGARSSTISRIFSRQRRIRAKKSKMYRYPFGLLNFYLLYVGEAGYRRTVR